MSTVNVFAYEENSNVTVYTIEDSNFSKSGIWYKSELKGYNDTPSEYFTGEESQAFWNVEAKQKGYYRIYFYNLIHSANGEKINIEVSYGDKSEKFSLNHNNTNEESGFVELNTFKVEKEQNIKITVTGTDNHYYRVNSIMIESFPYLYETYYDTDTYFRRMSGTWHESGLLGYNNTESIYGYDNASCRWTIRESGICEIQFYNIQHSGNSEQIKVSVFDKNGEHNIMINHKDKNGLTDIGRYEFSGNGSEYVKVTQIGTGFLRINLLKITLFGDINSQPDDSVFKERNLYCRNIELKSADEYKENIYVLPNSKNGDGTFLNPYGSIKEAQTAVRQLIKDGKANSGICVNLMPGIYETEDTLIFESQDSGVLEYPVIWRSYEDNAVLTTSKHYEREDFEKVNDNDLLEKINESARERLYKISVPEGINTEDMSISSPYCVVFDDTQGTLSRWPNEGYDKLGEIVDYGTRSDGGSKQRGFTYIINNEKILNWKDEKNAWLCGYWMTPYTRDFVKISKIDEVSMTISGLNGTELGAYGYPRYYGVNLFCELDNDGEWYIDKDTMYVILPDLCQDVYVSYNDSGILKMNNAHDMIFRGIDFKNSGGTGVIIDSKSTGCAIEGGSIKNITSTGISISGTDNYIRDCDISEIGGVGIQLNGGNQYNLTPGNNYAENNTITKTGKISNSKSAVTIGGCQNRVQNNHIFNVPTHGITGSGMENIIEYNIIERTNLEMGDTGGIYFLNYGMGYGTKIRYNIVKDSVGIAASQGFTDSGALGIYLDDMTSGVEVSSNIVYNAMEPALFGHGGRNLVFDNNIIINCDESIKIVKTGIAKNLDPENGTSVLNIKLYDNDTVRQKYPEAFEALMDDYGEPKYNRVTNNVLYNSKTPEIGSVLENSGTVQNNIEYNNSPESSCTDFYDFDFSKITEDNPHFKPIDISLIGTYKGGMRNDETDIIYDNKCEEFNLLLPENGKTDLSNAVTLSWEEKNGGIEESRVYISENPDMSDALYYKTSENSITLELEYGKTYYWRVRKYPFLDYQSQFNTNGVFSFTTMSYEDKYESLLYSIDALEKYGIINSDEVNGIMEELEKLQDLSEKIKYLELCTDGFLMENKNNGLQTVIYDSYENEIEGEKPYGLFLRSTEILDVTTAVKNENKCVKFNDTNKSVQYAQRCFYPEDYYVEFSSTITAQQTDGDFSMSLIKTGYHATKDGVSAGNAARIIFASDGIIYANAQKNHPIMRYESNKEYTVTISLSVKDLKYSVYINGELKADNISVNCDDLKSVGSILYDSSDSKSKESTGVFYVDNTLVKIPVNYGSSVFIKELTVNGKIYKNVSDNIINCGLDEQQLFNADIEVLVCDNAHYSVSKGDDKLYISVISGNYDNVKTYIVK